MNQTDWSRPSGYARWGWGWAAFAFFGGLFNLVRLVQDPTLVRLALAILTLASTAFCLVLWRKSVRLDREHRALMARLAGRLYGHSGGAR